MGGGMRYLSVCSGIEAASVAWHDLGWTPVAFSEIEPFPCAVLAHHYPSVPNWGDMTKFKEWPDADIDVLVGGTPCQSFSVAGLRKGMADPRGNLALTFLAIADRYRPAWLVWENVPGVLSSNGGRDFGSILGGMVELGYGVCYRVLDAQYFGVAQRRRRVFVVGYLGDWHRAAAVLLEPESLRGDSAPRREAGQRPAGSLAARTRGGGGLGTDTELDGGLIPQTVGALTDDAHNGGGSTAKMPTPDESSLLPDIVPQAMSAKWAKGTSGPAGDEVANLVPVRIGGGFDVAAFNATDYESGAFEEVECARGLTTSADRSCAAPIIAFAQNQRDEVRAVAGALAAEPGMKQQTYIAFSAKDHGADAGEIAPTLRSMGHDGSHANGGGQVAVAFESRFVRNGRGAPSDVVPPLKAQSGETGKGDAAPLVACSVADTLGVGANQTTGFKTDVAAVGMQVRRLTPTECERLQGFPDGWTQVPYRGKPAADGPKYKALGNSMAVPCMRWIGRRIKRVVEASTAEEKAA